MKHRHVCLLMLGALAVWPATVFAQTYTIQTGAPQVLQIAGVKAGDKVTVEAILRTGDPNENGENEPLIVGLPGGGTFVVSEYAAFRSTTFIAIQDGQTVTAYIQGFDGDEVGVVDLTVNARPRFTPEEKKAYADAAAMATTYALALTTASNFLDPIRAKIARLGEIAEAYLALHYNRLARDPFDPDFMIIPQPITPTATLVQAQPPEVTQELADRFNSLLGNQLQQIGLLRAIETGINRANSAADAGSAFWEGEQMRAAARYALQLAPLAEAEAGLRSPLLAALEGSGFPTVTLGPFDVFSTELSLVFSGLPDPEPQFLAEILATRDEVALVTELLFVQDIFDVAASFGTFPAFITDSTLAQDEAALAAALRSFAARNGGTPLKRGQMVQADGFVDTDQGRVTFALEAHLDGQGTLVGKLELHDHGSGFSILHSDLQRALLTGAPGFQVDGAYEAQDGTDGTFEVAADASQDTVAITLSDGHTFAGHLGGGVVKIKP